MHSETLSQEKKEKEKEIIRQKQMQMKGNRLG
jgi:hypothetical protein